MLLILLFLLVSIYVSKFHPEAKLQFVKYCQYFNYPVQMHYTTTQDGYILKNFRIQKKGTSIKDGLKPILLQHGLLDSSDTWILNDEDKAIGFMLANAGYDVWLGNSRGNKHSRRHVTYNPDKDKQYWQFTIQHMAQYDLPTMFRYINGKTNQQVNYIGHSQGTMIMHIALCQRNPVVQQLIGKYFAFGPVAYITDMSSKLMNLLDKSGLLQWYHLRHIYEFMPSPHWLQTESGIIFCKMFVDVCNDLLQFMMDADPSLDNYQRYDVFIGHDPSGTSVTNMAHWKQLLDHQAFRAYDYGSPQLNQQHYGQPYPPNWDLSNIRIPVRLFAGIYDELADPTDVQKLWSELTPSFRQSLKSYEAGHATFICGLTVTPWMTDVFNFFNQT